MPNPHVIKSAAAAAAAAMTSPKLHVTQQCRIQVATGAEAANHSTDQQREGGGGGVYSLAWIDDSRLVIGDGNGGIQVIHIGLNKDTGRHDTHQLKFGSLKGGLPLTGLQFDPRSRRVFAACTDGHILSCPLDHAVPEQIAVETDNEPMALCLLQDGGVTKLATGGSDAHVRIYDTGTNKLLHTYFGSRNLKKSLNPDDEKSRPGMKIMCLKTSPGNPSVFYSGGWESCIRKWDVRTSAGVVFNLSDNGRPFICGDAMDVQSSGGSDLLLTASWTQTDALQLWDSSSPRLMKTLPFPASDRDGEYLYCCRFVDESTVVAGGSGTRDAAVIDIASGKPWDVVSAGDKPVTSLAVTNRLVAAAGTDSDVITVATVTS